ncbi:MAG: M50 family metallopeptidase [Fervidobacterium sp.]|nr:M50 family metallopeptidase [Fervidobacterium sp.]
MVSDNFKPIAYPDIEKYELFKKKGNIMYCIGTIENDSFIIVPNEQVSLILRLLKLMNGKLSVSDIQKFAKENNMSIDIKSLITKLGRAGLIKNFNEHYKFSELQLFSFSMLSIDISLFCNYIKKRGMFLTIILILMLIVTILYVTIFLPSRISFNFNNIIKYDNSYLKNIILSLIFTIPCFLVHELGHIIFATRYGLTSNKLNIGLYYFVIPIVYVKIQGLYALPPFKRVRVLIAGIVFNFIFGLSCLFMWYIFEIEIFKTLFFVNIQIAFLNLTPFTFSDGYFIFSIVIGEPNLRYQYYKFLAGIVNKKFRYKLTFKQLIYIICSIVITILYIIVQVKVLDNVLYETLQKYGFGFSQERRFFIYTAMNILIVSALYLFIYKRSIKYLNATLAKDF